MTAKTQSRLFPNFLRNRQYSGTVSTLLYNWPIFAGIVVFGLVALISSLFVYGPWHWILLGLGLLTLLLGLDILIASYFVYDYGSKREYDRLADLAELSEANVVIDITCGKLRGTQGLLSRFQQGHYFVVDIYDPEKMTDAALRRARGLTPPLETNRRIYHRSAKPDSLPIPHNWADVVYCSFSLHELQALEDRQKIFAEFARILKPKGKLLIAEHGRDLPNTLAFGPGVLGFLTPAGWAKHIAEAGLELSRHERWRGLVHLWVATKK